MVLVLRPESNKQRISKNIPLNTGTVVERKVAGKKRKRAKKSSGGTTSFFGLAVESNQLLPLSPKLEVGQLPSFIWLLLKSVWAPLSAPLGQFHARWRECPDNWYTPYLHLT